MRSLRVGKFYENFMQEENGREREEVTYPVVIQVSKQQDQTACLFPIITSRTPEDSV
jgi:hypothetical protein